MPKIEVILYQETEQDVPVKDWLGALHARNTKAFNKCQDVIALLAIYGHELRRPHADILGTEFTN